MITTQQALEDVQWLRKHCAKFKLTAVSLTDKLLNVKYRTIAKWLEDGATIIPRSRSHTRSVAAYRRRVEKR